MENVTFCTPTPGTIIIACDFIITIGILYLIDYPFCTWSGSVASNKEGIPTLVFVALNGYHGVVKYSWSLNNEELEEQVHSIMYTNTPVYSNAQIATPSVEAREEFNIRNTTV